MATLRDMLAAAQNSDPQTMAGLALGKLLRGLFDDWKANYDARGAQNDKILDPNTPPEERAALLEQISANNPKRAERLFGQLGEGGINAGDAPQITSTPQISGINQNARARIQAAPNLLGDTDWDRYKNLGDALNSARAGWRYDWRL